MMNLQVAVPNRGRKCEPEAAQNPRSHSDGPREGREKLDSGDLIDLFAPDRNVNKYFHLFFLYSSFQ